MHVVCRYSAPVQVVVPVTCVRVRVRAFRVCAWCVSVCAGVRVVYVCALACVLVGRERPASVSAPCARSSAMSAACPRCDAMWGERSWMR